MNEKSVSGWRNWVRARPVSAFFFLTFLISWIVWGLGRVLIPETGRGIRFAVHNLGLCGPTLAALLLSGLLYGRKGACDLLKRIGRWRVGIGWYLFAVLATLALGLAARGLYSLTFGAPPALDLQIMWVQILILPSGLPEEYGWRGFALPHLLRRRSALTASLIIAVFWVLWHIPISPILNDVRFLGLFLLEVIPLSVVFSWLYINSRGSILLVVLFHFVTNGVVQILNIPGAPSLWAIYVGLYWLLAAGIIVRNGAARLSRQGGADIEGNIGALQDRGA
ncbi:MAG: CPBP family intramembrane metalloprotease [Acidobacteria bacterium]|nr:CPBP family intramembrane metalloprotease [Acidobacteriota bacterium]